MTFQWKHSLCSFLLYFSLWGEKEVTIYDKLSEKKIKFFNNYSFTHWFVKYLSIFSVKSWAPGRGYSHKMNKYELCLSGTSILWGVLNVKWLISIIIGSVEELEPVWGSKTCSELKNIKSEIWRLNIIS